MTAAVEPTLEDKVAFLSRPDTYSVAHDAVIRRETHMSWVFLVADRVYKLKKPVRFAYLDFSTLERREAACRAELKLNRRLAPEVYLDVVPLTITANRLSLDRSGSIVDWVVMMRRLDERLTLQRAIQERRVETRQLDLLAEALVQFYRRAPSVWLPAILQLSDWHRSLSYNRHMLLDPRFALPSGLIRYIDIVQRRFLSHRSGMIIRRVQERRVVDGHGDLRPEHVWLDAPIKIIDCLEFNPRLRAVDPFDEIAFLSLECDRLGAGWAGDYIRRRVVRRLRDGLSEELFLFYRCHRATLRARLAIAHLLEAKPRTPDKWPRLARTYLQLAARDAKRIERSFNSP
jgi:aminoglycoside phosphotransferase family enzyme